MNLPRYQSPEISGISRTNEMNRPSFVQGTGAQGTTACDGGIATAVFPPETVRHEDDSQATETAALILDGNTRSALAATRSLGKKGVHVVVGGETSRTLAGASRYCRESFTYPSPAEDLLGFLAMVNRECRRRGIGVILPMAELSTWTVLRHREAFEPVRVPFVELKAFDVLTDKWRLLKLAQQLQLSIPRTEFVSEINALGDICGKLKFPVVMKPHRSMLWSQGRWISTSVHYARSEEELKELATRYEYFRQHPFLIQEYITGQGQGVFALYDHGSPMAFFAHRRLRERPPAGGVSVLSESIEPHPMALAAARALLDCVGWHGVAMVEFKVSAAGTPYLMEVNGRFWGSLQLAIDAGADFPWLVYQLAMGRDLGQVKPYTRGVRCRWLLGDFVRLCKVLTNNGSGPKALPLGKARSVLQFLKYSGGCCQWQINRWEDLRPFLLEVTQYVKGLGSGFLERMGGGRRRVLSPKF